MVTGVRFLILNIYMNKFLCSIVLMLSVFSVHAQSQDSQEEMQILVQKVDSLEHELAYLRLTYELETLNSDIKMFANEVCTKYNTLRLELLGQNFNSILSAMYQQEYEVYQQQKQAFSELIEAKKTFFTLKVLTFPYSESELEVLSGQYSVLDKAYASIEASLNLLKITIDAYNDFL